MVSKGSNQYRGGGAKPSGALAGEMTVEQWEEVTDGLLRMIEVQGKCISALSRALAALGAVLPVVGGEPEVDGTVGDEEGAGVKEG